MIEGCKWVNLVVNGVVGWGRVWGCEVGVCGCVVVVMGGCCLNRIDGLTLYIFMFFFHVSLSHVLLNFIIISSYSSIFLNIC